MFSPSRKEKGRVIYQYYYKKITLFTELRHTDIKTI